MSVVEIPLSIVFYSSGLRRLSEDLNVMSKVGMKEARIKPVIASMRCSLLLTVKDFITLREECRKGRELSVSGGSVW